MVQISRKDWCSRALDWSSRQLLQSWEVFLLDTPEIVSPTLRSSKRFGRRNGNYCTPMRIPRPDRVLLVFEEDCATRLPTFRPQAFAPVLARF